MAARIERTFRLGTVLALALFVAACTMVYRSTERLVGINRLVEHSQQVLVKLEDLQSALDESVSSTRNYVLSGDESNLVRFATAKRHLIELLEPIQSLTADEASQQKSIQQLKSQLASTYEYWEDAVAKKRAGESADADHRMSSTQTLRLMRENRQIIGAMIQRENELLRFRSQNAETSARRAIVIELLLAAATLAVLAMAYLFVQTEMNQKAKSLLALRRSEKSYRRLVELSPDAMWVHQNGIILFANSASVALFGASSVDQIVGKPVIDFIHPDDRQIAKQRMQKLFERRDLVRAEARFVRLDGGETCAEIVACTVIYQGELAAQVTFRDIAERKRAEEELRKSEANLANAQKIAHLGSFEQDLSNLGDLEKNPLHWSAEAFRIFGYEPGAMEVSRSRFLSAVHPDDRDRIHTAVTQAIRNQSSCSLDYRIIRSDGAERIIHSQSNVVCDGISGKPIRLVGTMQDITEHRHAQERIRRLAQAIEHSRELIGMGDLQGRITFANRAFLEALGYSDADIIGLPWSTVLSPNNRPGLDEEIRLEVLEKGGWKGECLQRRKDGTDLPVYLSVGPLVDGAGSISGTMGIAQDISERKKLEEQYRQAQKMEAVGRLSGGIAHDFNNLLGVVIGYAEILQERLDPAMGLHKPASEIMKAAQRAASLTRQLLAFSRQQVLETRVLGLNSVVIDMEKMLQRLIGEHIELRTQLASDLGNVKADQGQIEQVILNLAVNARDAMPKGGKLIIGTANVEVDEAYVRQRGHISIGSYVMLVVSDSGVGMNAETRSHIFEPFFTTKEQGKGTGLGLATVYGVVKQSGGFIWVHSEPGHGTTFEILLPQVKQRVQSERASADSERSGGGSETVLVVEDDASLRELTMNLLSNLGYTVLEASNGLQALNMAQEKPRGQIHLLLTDVVMPGMSGPQLADELASRHPEMKILYMSGYTEFASGHDQISQQGRFLLQKPFTQQDLGRKIRQALESDRVSVTATRA